MILNDHCKKLRSLDNFEEELQKHLSSCKECKEEFDIRKELVDLLKEIRPSVRFQTEKTKDCLDTETLNKYKQNKMTEEEVLKIEDHISRCHYCLDEVFNVKNIQESRINTDGYESIPDYKLTDYNTFKFNIQKSLPYKGSLLTREAANQKNQTVPKSKKVVLKHEVNISPINGKIVLTGENNRDEKYSDMSDTIDGHEFFYKIFYINKEYKIDKVSHIFKEEYVDKMRLKDEGYPFLIVLISQHSPVLETLNKDLLLSIYAGKPYEPLKDIIRIFVTIKRD